MRACVKASVPSGGVFPLASQAAVSTSIQSVMSHFRSNSWGQRHCRGASDPLAYHHLHPFHPPMSAQGMFWQIGPWLTVGLLSPIRLWSSWGQRPNLIFIRCPTNLTEPHPWRVLGPRRRKLWAGWILTPPWSSAVHWGPLCAHSPDSLTCCSPSHWLQFNLI